ncbi:MAG: hypothetical protein ABI977_03295 [Acidobacteriota bacterium]
MPSEFSSAFDACQINQLHQAWQDLCARYLPIAPIDSIWRYSRPCAPQDPEQGWKLHLSATIFNAVSLLERVAPLLTGHGVQFKTPASLQELHHINSGLYHGYSQVGKCLTVYARTEEEAVTLAEELHVATGGINAPAVPFDLRYRSDSNVYYRYGAFRRFTLEGEDGVLIPALRDPHGNLVPDSRTAEAAKPDWVANPFPIHPVRLGAESASNPLKTTYRAFRALTQRGKGGVYQAIDLGAHPPRFCVIKEGRKDGELGWDGRDGRWRIQHEEQVLASLLAQGLEMPQIYASFELEDHYYLVTEFIAGTNFQHLLNQRRRRFSIYQALRYGSEMAAILFRIHSAGWVWRDCKPANFILTDGGVLRPLDFEGACPINQPDPVPWGSPAFAPAAGRTDHSARSSIYDDLYSLGVVIHLLLTGRLPVSTAPLPWQKLRRGIPADVRELVTALLFAPPDQRPSADIVAQQLAESRANLRLVAAGD